MDIFRNINNEGVTIVMVTHEPETASKCKNVVTFIDGKIIEELRN